jgi:hypothetical protein
MASLRNTDDDELGPEYDDEQLADVYAMSPQLTPPRTRMRSTEESDGCRTPSAPCVGETWKIALAIQCTNGTSTTLLQRSRIGSTEHRLVPSQKQLYHPNNFHPTLRYKGCSIWLSAC